MESVVIYDVKGARKGAKMIPTYKFALREDIKEDKRFLPTKGEPKATGWDVRLYVENRKSVILRPGQKALLDLGIRGYCPDGWYYDLKPRSGTFHKKSMHCLYGTIDETFEGYLKFACQYIPDVNSLGHDLILEHGDALGQIIPVKRQDAEMITISNEEIEYLYKNRNEIRGTGGFGSTGK